VTGRVIDAAGSPVAGLTLRFQMPNSTRRTSATSREDGSITCGGLHETIDCDMSVDPDDKAHAGFLVSPNSVSPRSAEPVTFTVGPPATARGRIVDSSGAPVANWSIWLLPTAGGSEYGARTDAEGRFTAKPLPAGRYRVKVVWVPNRARERPHIVGEVETGADEVRFIYPETIVR
jgi:hypothetical protein